MASFDRIDAIPTRWNGVDFRSLLEARWACMFTLMRLNWTYEPLELGGTEPGTGFIPDFILDAPLFSGPTETVFPLLVEVKPNTVPEDYRDAINKIARSGWAGAAMVLGCVMRERTFLQDESEAEYWFGYAHPRVRPFHAEPVANEWFQVGAFHDSTYGEGPKQFVFGFGGAYNLTAMWRESGNRVRWSPNR